MKYPTIFCLICGSQLVMLSIMMQSGFVEVTHEWENFIGHPLDEVKESMSKIFPNVPFAVFNEGQMRHYSSEFYYNKIKLVVNPSNIVVSNPSFLGSEPDLEFNETLVGKSYEDVIAILRTRFDGTKIAVTRDGKIIAVDPKEAQNIKDNYIEVKVDSGSKVTEKPIFVRVPAD